MTNVNSSSHLSALKLPELQALASSLGISGASKLRKGDLVAAISVKQGGDAAAPSPTTALVESAVVEAATLDDAPQAAPVARKRTSRRVTSADTEAIAAAPILAGAPVVDETTTAVAQENEQMPSVSDTQEPATRPARRPSRRRRRCPSG